MSGTRDLRPTRRTALRALVAAGAALALPRRLCARPPDRVRLAFFGIGGRGRGNVLNLAEQEAVAFADVDDHGGPETRAEFPQVPVYRDARRLLDRHADAIDGVVISTPDHTHLPLALLAFAAGKHVYLEKPLAPTIGECQELRRAAAAAGVCAQLGVQGHSFEGLRVLREWLDAGAAGRVRSVELWSDRMSRETFVRADTLPAAMAAPPSLAWDLWLGTRPFRPYHSDYTPRRWRNWWDFGAGALADIGVHMFDVLAYTLDFGYPEAVAAESAEASLFTAPAWTRVTWTFPATAASGALGVTWTGGWRDGVLVKPASVPRVPPEVLANVRNGIAIVGDEGTLLVPDMRASSRPRLFPIERERDLLAAPPPRRLPRPKGGHHQEWIDAIRVGRAPAAPFDYGAMITESVLLGTLAQRTGRPVRCDAASGRILDNPAAIALVPPPERRG